MVATDEGIDVQDGPRARWVRVLLIALVTVVGPALMVGLVIVRSPEFSVLDEPAHSDYLRRIEQGEVPRVGDKVLAVTVRDIQCRTVQGRTNAPCGLDRYTSDMVGAGGYQYEAQQPPVYYVVTAGLRVFTRIGPADDFVTTARLTGAVWLAAGLLVFVAACRRLGCRWWPTILMAGILAISPGVLYQSATINNDAAAVLTGSLALLMFAVLRERVGVARVAGWAVVAVLLVLVKPTGIVAVAAATGALLVDALAERRFTARGALILFLPLVAAFAAYMSWSQVREARSTVSYDIVLDNLLGFKQVDELPLDQVVVSVTRLTGAYAGGGVPIAPGFVAGPASILMLGLTAAGTISLWARRGGEAAHRVGSLALLALLAGGPAFTLLFYFDYSIEGGPTSRYGLSLLPLLAASGAATYRTRRALVTMGIVAVIMLVPLFIAINYPTTRPGRG